MGPVNTGAQMQETSPAGGADVRAAARTNLFLAATLHAGDAAHPVKIRNLSSSGAQIETSLFPEVGAAMTLARGRLSVHGQVTWCGATRCGLKFSSPVSVQDWMANPVNLEQRRVDDVVAAVKSGAAPLVAPARGAAVTADGVADDLKRVSRLLEMLGDALAGDPWAVTRHGITLQNLDIAVQTLTVLAATIRTGAPADAKSRARLDELRASCAQALGGPSIARPKA